jgi:hypothetical protein
MKPAIFCGLFYWVINSGFECANCKLALVTTSVGIHREQRATCFIFDLRYQANHL